MLCIQKEKMIYLKTYIYINLTEKYHYLRFIIQELDIYSVLSSKIIK